MRPFSFRKGERLHQQKKIKELFEKGSSFYLHPFKVFVMATSGPGHQVLISVPNRIFRRAVDRNLIKRRIREAYRLHRHKLSRSESLAIALVYAGSEVLSYAEIACRMPLVFGKAEKASRQASGNNSDLK